MIERTPLPPGVSSGPHPTVRDSIRIIDALRRRKLGDVVRVCAFVGMPLAYFFIARNHIASVDKPSSPSGKEKSPTIPMEASIFNSTAIPDLPEAVFCNPRK
jgi:hypothetical protein